MSTRSPDDFNHERQALDAAHTQNEAGRDAFVALAHTALFAASVSFVGDVAPITDAIWKPSLLLGWAADVTGLVALTFSFGAARKAIDARRKALNDPDPPEDRLAERLNAIALWSFPVALIFLFAFVTANVVQANDRKSYSAKAAELPRERGNSSPSCPQPIAVGAPARSNAGTTSTVARPTAATAAVKAVRANEGDQSQAHQRRAAN